MLAHTTPHSTWRVPATGSLGPTLMPWNLSNIPVIRVGQESISDHCLLLSILAVTVSESQPVAQGCTWNRDWGCQDRDSSGELETLGSRNGTPSKASRYEVHDENRGQGVCQDQQVIQMHFTVL